MQVRHWAHPGASGGASLSHGHPQAAGSQGAEGGAQAVPTGSGSAGGRQGQLAGGRHPCHVDSALTIAYWQQHGQVHVRLFLALRYQSSAGSLQAVKSQTCTTPCTGSHAPGSASSCDFALLLRGFLPCVRLSKDAPTPAATGSGRTGAPAATQPNKVTESLASCLTKGFLCAT